MSAARLILLIACCITFFHSGNAQLGESRLHNRPYEVLLKENLVLLISVLCTLLVVMIGMAVCVYKPLRRR